MGYPMSKYDIGDSVKSEVRFTDAEGNLADPTAVTVAYRLDGGAITTWVFGVDPEVINDSVGVYHADIVTTAAGVMCIRWAGTGAVIAAVEGRITIKDSCIV
jgi:hypothetical protein